MNKALVYYSKNSEHGSKTRILESGLNPKNIWLNGAKHIAVATLNLTSQLDLSGMIAVRGSSLPNDQKGQRLDFATLSPGSWVTVRLPNGRVNHTLAILPDDNPTGMLMFLKHQSHRL